MIVAAAKARTSTGPALSPLIALLGGRDRRAAASGCSSAPFVREALVPLLAIAGFGAAIGLGDLAVGRADGRSSAGRARCASTTSTIVALVALLHRRGSATVLLSWRALAPREAAHGEYYALLLTAAAGMVVLAARAEPRDAVPGPRAAVDPALRPVRDRDAPRARRWSPG